VVKDKNAENIVRRKAAEALGKMGADAKSAVPALTDVVKEPKADRELRNAAVEALGNMGPAAKDALPTLTSLNKKQRDRTFKKLLDESVKKIQDR
jgi:HEAT repeat protein